jgi:hypothetical protein
MMCAEDVRAGRVERVVRVVSWNIRAGGGKRVAALAAQLVRWQPDVVVLCEFRATPSSVWLAGTLAAAGFVYQECTADTARASANCLLVASRWPLRRLRARHAPAAPGR